MANQEQLGILKQGVKVWNAWRKENLSVQIDLSDANLRDANLRGVHLLLAGLRNANLRDANLRGANLSGAILCDADLSGAILRDAALVSANLRDATLRGANLSGAILHEATLVNANLSDATLHEATLDKVNLSDAAMSNTDLSEATLSYTTLGAVDLSSVKGLETVRHIGPSSIGIDTIYLSKGNIPEAFLKGAGVDDTFITYIRSLIGKPIEYYSCFISYSSMDDAFAKRLYADLQNNNVRCWFAPEDLKIGDKIRTGIDKAIRLHDKLLLVLSGNSVESAWVEKEVETAFDIEAKTHKLVLFPVRLDDAVMETDQAWAADIRRMRNIGDFTRWKNHDDYQKAFQRLLKDLKSTG